MKYIKQVFIVVVACLVTLGLANESKTYATVPGVNQYVSSSSSGTLGNLPANGGPSISADGRYVAFSSGASNLVTGDTNGKEDVFVKDMTNGSIVMASVSTAGAQSSGDSGEARISHDGRYVVFWNNKNDLDPALGNNNISEIYRRDLVNNVTVHVSLTPTGYGCNGYGCNSPDISADGRFIAFVGGTDALVGGPGAVSSQIYVRDMVTGKNKMVSIRSSGAASSYGGLAPRISCDGGVVVFSSYADDMRADTGSSYRNVHYAVRAANDYVVNATSGTNGHTAQPDISCDGTHISFHSVASNLVANDTNAKEDIFIYNIVDKTTKIVSMSSGGVQGNANCDSISSLSGDGNIVAYACQGTNLVSGDTNGATDVFISSVKTGVTERVSVDGSLGNSNGTSYAAEISYDGKYVAYNTYATNLTSGSDTNGYQDIVLSETGY